MHFILLALMLATPAPRQDTLSSAGVTTAPARNAAQEAGPEPPVSLDRIRELLAQPATLQQSLLKRPTFKVEVEERRHIQELLSTIDFDGTKPGPVPFGGLYGYETQRVMMSSVGGGQMMQPYVPYSGGELLTLAFEALLKKYLGWRALDAITAADKSRAAAAAKAEVARAIVQYCDGLPGKGAGVGICTEIPPSP